MSILIDIVLAALLIYFISSGMKKGGARGILELLSFFVTIIAVMLFKNTVTEFLSNLEPVKAWTETMETAISQKAGFAESLPAWLLGYGTDTVSIATELVSFVLCTIGFIVTYIIVRLAFRLLVGVADKLMSLPLLRSANKLLGGIFGGIKGCFVVWILMSLMFLFAASSWYPDVNSAIADSFLAKALYNNNLLFTLFQ